VFVVLLVIELALPPLLVGWQMRALGRGKRR
jgi:hypothetical protein